METSDFSRRLPMVRWEEINTLSRAFNDVLAVADRLIREKDYMATTDSLTGIRNRLKFIQVMEGEILRHHRHGAPLSLVMFDIDHFKRINDTFGHDAGDIVLKRVAATISERVRVTDTFARWGGEEFILLLPGTDGRAAGQLVEQLRASIAAIDFGPVGQVTASFGTTGFQDSDDVTTFCHRVDQALYSAKHGGRNQVCAQPH
ncbi:MAG: diguanylate cyclase [Rhodospirillaceae bacterium]|nr:MAG: diguanylate cyclase [Rhodospirillaceae bacterium]